MKDKNIVAKVSLDGKHIADLRETKGVGLYGWDPHEYEYYLNRNGKFWFRNYYAKVSIDVTLEEKKEIGYLKYGDKVRIEY